MYFYSQGGETYGIIEISLWIIRIFFNVSIDSILLKYHLWLGAVAPLTTACVNRCDDLIITGKYQ